ncbi:sensor histidine kinase [Amphritea opalescens]|uniref:histidine kinase n=1 Tax=Amphritea opalescens TaxID=2490544 RepID=A0A430KSD4_9GAMM|nr:HAMP domain-containing sensor histidine kinase [Amphritea opalescens]RTE66386.1 sensor histidine kinase [Amphritea opalescens]
MQLVVLAFFLVVAPLGVLIYQATDSMVTLSRQGREHAKEALDFFSRSQHLRELSGDLVRSARQYDVLKKADIEERFRSQLAEYKQLLQLHSFLIDSSNIETIFALIAELEATPLNNEADAKVSALVPLTQTLYADTRKKLDQRLESLNAKAEEQQNLLWLQAGLLITLSTILILFFSIRITRPVKQLMLRIKALGHGQLDMSKPFKGPKEFLALNQQLEWLETHLQLLEQEKQAFLRHMSHELKTPLTTLREGTDLLAEELAGPLTHDQKEIITLMQDNSISLQSLIEQLLDYNRLQHAGEHDLQTQPILPIIQESLASHQLLLKQKQIQVTLPKQDHPWLIDKELLQRTLSNLISNASVYGSENGLLKISLTVQDSCLRIEVGNTGPEIPDSDLAQLFDPFFQGVNKRQGSVKGSGIGLSIARESIKAMGGNLELHSNQDGFVSFMISIPNQGQTTHE